MALSSWDADVAIPCTACIIICGQSNFVSIEVFPYAEPPSACTNIEVIARADTTITVRWNQPKTTGRTDYFYRVFHSDPDNIGEFILARNNLMDRRATVTFTVANLTPFTPYIIRVTTHNGVSDLDPDGANSRICEIPGITEEGGELATVQ
jgi:hypothetical protein